MESRGIVTVRKIVPKVLHALLAGFLTWSFFESRNDNDSVWVSVGAGVCGVWFVVAICLFFKNRFQWYPRAAAIFKTVLKVLNVADATFCSAICCGNFMASRMRAVIHGQTCYGFYRCSFGSYVESASS